MERKLSDFTIIITNIRHTCSWKEQLERSFSWKLLSNLKLSYLTVFPTIISNCTRAKHKPKKNLSTSPSFQFYGVSNFMFLLHGQSSVPWFEGKSQMQKHFCTPTSLQIVTHSSTRVAFLIKIEVLSAFS